MKKISILIPAYNEEKTFSLLYDQLVRFMDAPEGLGSRYEFEVLLVNDGSSDRTLELIQDAHRKDSRFNYVSLSRNFGKENAMLAGFDHVTGDCCVIMDADLQHPIETIPEMVSLWEDGYDDVYGKRKTRGKESRIRKRLSLIYYDMLQHTTRFDILPNVGDFRLLDRHCIEKLRQLRETQRYTKGLYAWIGYKKGFVEFEQKESARDKSTFNFKSLLNLAIEGITCFTTAPLRIASVAGFAVAAFAMIYLAWIFIKTCIWGDAIQGFPTIMCTILLLGGVQLMAIGIIGEYVGRIFNESKNRPPYIADMYNDKKI